MKTHQPWQQAVKGLMFSTIALFSLMTTTTMPLIAQAQPPSKPRKIRWKPPTPPSSLGTAINRGQGGGQRGCEPYQGITALVPVATGNIAWGQTISDRPTVWLNTPQGLGKDLLMEVAVREENGKPIAKQLLTTAQETSAGVISVPFPPSAVLQTDRNYRWEIAVYCDTGERVDSPLVISGQIQRIAPPTGLNHQSPLQTAQDLAEKGIWYDAVTQIGKGLRGDRDPALASAWSDLMRSANLSATSPIQDCCEFDSTSK
jgi:hypothetical protein